MPRVFRVALFLYLLVVCAADSFRKHLINGETVNVPKVDKSKYISNFDPPFILRDHPISADVILHSAYLEIEETTTSYLFLMEVSRSHLDKITGCGVGNLKAKPGSLSLSILTPESVYKKEKDTDQFEVVLKCSNLPYQEGKSAFVLYQFTDIIELAVEAQKPVSLHGPETSSSEDFTVMVCVNANDKDTPWLSEFIRYQKSIGVDHVHVSVFDEYIMAGRMFEQVDRNEDVKQLVLNDYVTLSMWNNWYKVDAKVPNNFSDLIRKLDCIFQYRSMYDYVMALDSDDFFIPVGNEKNLKKYISKWCSIKDGSEKSSCLFKRLQYYCGLKSDSDKAVRGNITEILSSYKYKPMEESRTVLYSSAVDVMGDGKVNIDSSCKDCLADGYSVVDVPQSEAYIAKIDNPAKNDNEC